MSSSNRNELVDHCKYKKFFTVDEYPNGNGLVLYLNFDDIKHLDKEEIDAIALEFQTEAFRENEQGFARYVIAVIKNAAEYFPDPLEYLADNHPNTKANVGTIYGQEPGLPSQLTLAEYRDQVHKNNHGLTFRLFGLEDMHLNRKDQNDCGGNFPDILSLLEQSPFLKTIIPWGKLSRLNIRPEESREGPMFWTAPGEQLIPYEQGDSKQDSVALAKVKARLDGKVLEQRTKSHADLTDLGHPDSHPTAAIAFTKSVLCGEKSKINRVTKEVIVFDASHYKEMYERLNLVGDLNASYQCEVWLDFAELNKLREEGIKYAHLFINHNDIYYIPRKVLHQFRSISSSCSVAWHHDSVFCRGE